MSETERPLAGSFSQINLRMIDAAELRVAARTDEGETVSRNTNRLYEEAATFGERVADRIVSFGGSWTFIIFFAAVFAAWIALNSFVLMMRDTAFDPYPYILLNLALSTIAAFQAQIIMMSQNRQAAKDHINAAHAYEINLKMGLEVRRLHEKIDALRGEQLPEMLAMHQAQVHALNELLNRNARAKASW